MAILGAVPAGPLMSGAAVYWVDRPIPTPPADDFSFRRWQAAGDGLDDNSDIGSGHPPNGRVGPGPAVDESYEGETDPAWDREARAEEDREAHRRP
jgi:hypothetical protein